MTHAARPLPSRQALALLRLLLLYGLLCGLLTAGGLLYRAAQEGGWGAGGATVPTGLPFGGVNVDAQAPPGPGRRATLAALREAGFGFVRLRLDWGTMEPQRSSYNWQAADAWLADIAAAGLVPMIVLDGSPSWARAPEDLPPTDSPLAPPADPGDFAAFAGAFAARYADQVRLYQVWDEPNIAPHWGNRWVDPFAYAQLLKAAAAAIRAANPQAVVATAALAPTADRGHMAVDEVLFLQRMLAAGAAGAFDAVAVQPFGFGYAPGDRHQGREILSFQRAAHIRRALVSMGLGDKPLWGVRFGFNRAPNATWGTVTPQAQAIYAAEALDLAWNRWPWLEALGWAVARPPAEPEDARGGFALWELDGTPAPVLGALGGWLSTPRPAQRLSAQAGVLALPCAGGLLPCLPGAGWFTWVLWGGGLAIVAWRGKAAARLLPWAQWLNGWRDLPRPVQAAGWMGLLLLYYYATWPPLIGLCWIFWALLCLAQPRAGLMLAALLLPFYFQHKDLHLVDAVLAVPPVAAAAACLLPALLVRARGRPWFGAVDATVLALLGISLLPAVHVWQWPAYGQGLLDLVLVPLVLWCAVRILSADTSRRTPPPGGGVLLALFAGGVLVAGWGLATWAGGAGGVVDGVRRLVGPHFSPNHTALYLLRTLFLGLGVAALLRTPAHGPGAWERGRRAQALRAGVEAGVVLVGLALVLTGSRGALLLGLPLGTLVMGWAVLDRRPDLLRRLADHPRTRWALMGGLLLLAAGVLLLWDRLLNQETLSLRIDLWEASLRLWRDHLLLGVGPGSFPWSYAAYLPPSAGIEPNQLHPHNIWLEVATTWGLVGFAWLAVLLWHVVGALQPAWGPQRAALAAKSAPALPRNGREAWLSVGLGAALLAAVAHGQMDAFFLLPDLAGWNALALALLVSHLPGGHSAG